MDGVGELAREKQNRDAVEALWEFLKQPSLSIRRAAIQSLYGAAGNNKRVRDRIGSLLPDEQRFLLDLKPVEVTDVPQISRPQRHLSAAGREERPEPPPAFRGDVEPDEGDESRPANEERLMATCTVPAIPNKDTSGDNLYGPRSCWQAFIDWAWAAHGFRNSYWDDGFGYEDPCNTDLPLARTLNALWLLNYSADDYWNEQWSNNILHWGRRYVRDQIDDLRSKCGDGTAIAAAFSGIFVDDRVELYLGFFYSKDCPGRAETFVHESRHMGGKSHNANFPAGSVFGAGKSGADSTWGYNGAWMYGALYLWWFYADGRRTTTALRQAARQRANLVIDNAFATHPGFTIA